MTGSEERTSGAARASAASPTASTRSAAPSPSRARPAAGPASPRGSRAPAERSPGVGQRPEEADDAPQPSFAVELGDVEAGDERVAPGPVGLAVGLEGGVDEGGGVHAGQRAGDPRAKR